MWPRPGTETPPLALVERRWDPNPLTAVHIRGLTYDLHCGAKAGPGGGLIHGGLNTATCWECMEIERKTGDDELREPCKSCGWFHLARDSWFFHAPRAVAR